MIKNVLFDIGNVLVDFYPLEYVHQTVKDKSAADTLYKVIFCGEEWQRLDEGTMTEDEAFEAFRKACPNYSEFIDIIKSDWYSMLKPIDGTVEILREIKRKGYGTYIISNYHLKTFDMIYNKYDFFKLFDGMVISSRVKLLKPDNRIFYRLIEDYNIVPGETAYIDDLQTNLDAAQKLGFVPVLFKSPEKLRKQLEQLNII